MKRILIYFFLLFAVTDLFAQKTVVLEDARIKAVFDCRNGALVQLTDKMNSWDVVQRKHLGQSFQMLVPIEGDAVPFEKEVRFNNIDGIDQKAPVVSRSGNSVSFTWKKLYSPANRKTLDIAFTATATLSDRGLVFDGCVVNNSDFVVEYVAWPYLGEVALPDKRHDFFLDTKNYVKSLYPRFPSEHGYWGVEYPTSMAYLPNDSYIMMRNDQQGFVVHSTREVRQFVIGSFELAPGYEVAYLNPEGDTVDGQDVRIIFKANRVFYAPKGTVSELDPVCLTFYSGSWYKGVDVVRNASKTDTGWPAEIRTWRRISAADPRDLVAQARDAIDNGVDVLLVSNWYKSGDNRLAETRAGYDEAIVECRKLGVRVILETDFLRADSHSLQYKTELQKLIVADPYGYYYNKFIMCPLCDRTQALVEESYDQTFRNLKADGAVCTDVPIRIKTIFCHDPRHGHVVPQYTAPAMVRTDAAFAGRAKRTDAAFKVGGNYLYDVQGDYFDFMVLPQLEKREALRYLNPGLAIVAPIDVRSARADVNTCVKNQYVVCYGALFRTNSLASYPNVVKYVNAVERFRMQLREYLWDAEMTDRDEVEVIGCDSYAVYRSKTGRRAVVLVNEDTERVLPVSVAFAGAGSGFVGIASPEEPEVRTVTGKFEIPQLSVVVAIENQ